MASRRQQNDRNKQIRPSDLYDIHDPPSLDPNTDDSSVVHGFGQAYPEDAPTVMAWNVEHLRAEAGWLLNSATPAPVRVRDPDSGGILVQKLESRSAKAAAATPGTHAPTTPTWLTVLAVVLLFALLGTTTWYVLI